MGGCSDFCLALCSRSLCLLSSLFVLVGIGMIAVPVYVLLVTHQIGTIFSDGFHSIPVLLIVLGTIVTIIFLCGCCGFKKQNSCLILTFTCILGVILIMELVAGFSAFMLRNQTEEIFDHTLEKTFKQYGGNDSDVTLLWDHLQQDLHCCGLYGSEDFVKELNMTAVPESCCVVEKCDTSITANLFSAPCRLLIKNVLLDNITLAAKWAIGIGCFHLFLVVGSCCMGMVYRGRGSYENV